MSSDENEIKEGDRIKVVHKTSKHFGKKGRVKKIGKSRYTVVFDNNLTGRYVEISHAEKIPHTQNEYEKILENLAITAGTLIAQEQPEGSRNLCARAFTLLVKQAMDKYQAAKN